MDEYEKIKEKAKGLPLRKLMSLNHVLMDWANQAEIPAQRIQYQNVTDRHFTIMPNNFVAVRLNILYVYEVDVQHGFIDADVSIDLEWIDDRFRFRNHPNESLAQLDNPDLTDFRAFDSEMIWTPDITIANKRRNSVSEDLKQPVWIDLEFGAVIWKKFAQLSGIYTNYFI